MIRSHLARIEAADAALGAFVEVGRDAALCEAQRADAATASGRAVGPLHGVPIALKDIFAVRGLATTNGSLGAPAHPSRDSTVAHRLREAGAILVGKLTTSEYSCGSPYLLRRPQNPWHRDHVPGGSSAGAGIAVSARLVPGAIGGDTGGSVRIPASFCGVLGLRPTAGLVPTSGVTPLAPGIDVPGPLTRTSADAEVLLRTMARPGGGTAIGTARSISLVGSPPADRLDPVVANAVERVAREGAEVLGVHLRVVSPERLHRAWAGAWVLIYARALSVHLELLRAHFDRLSRPLIWKLCAAAALSQRDRDAAKRIRAEAVDFLSTTVADGSLIIMPTMAFTANRVDARYRGEDTMTWTAPASLAGLPAVTLPAARNSSGLPIGVQMIAAANTDLELLDLAGRLEMEKIVGDLGVPADIGDASTGSSLVPAEEPPAIPVTAAQVREVRLAARRMGLPAVDEALATGAARSLQAVRLVLY
ncbi:MAG TPA: amidase [Gemmatimonadales bacterium]|nr:amidase [Gemmatimonadales bacterium]